MVKKSTVDTGAFSDVEDEQRDRFEFNREPDRADRLLDGRDVRERDDFYDHPDIDNFDGTADIRALNLIAPPPRIDETHGPMRQYWAAYGRKKGRRIQELMSLGYRARHPNTVPLSFKSYTEKWESHDVIEVAGEHILMEISEKLLNQRNKRKRDANNAIINDIRQKHGQIIRDGQIIDEKLPNLQPFTQEYVVDRSQHGGDISFAD